MSDELITIPYEKAVNKASDFLEKILLPPAEEVGLILKDQVRFWRVKNQVNILLKAQEYCIKKGIKPGRIPTKTLVPLLEYGSLEEDPTIQKKWASLLAHAADPNFSKNIITSYARILSQLSPTEVIILDKIFADSEAIPPEKREKTIFSTEKVCEIFHLSDIDFKILLGNLTRLNILQAPASHEGAHLGEYPIVFRTDKLFELTHFGYDFIKQCKYE
jgi:hypothetical protein